MQKKQRTPQKEAEELVAQLQHLLRLDDWRIKAIVCNMSDLDSHDVGQCQYNLDFRAAEIYVVPPGQYKVPKEQQLEEFRRTIVHEVSHIIFGKLMGAGNTESRHQHIALENCAESLSNALYVALYERKPTNG